MAIQLDLRRDLPKVRKQWRAVTKALSTNLCDYTAPCVVGAMVPKNRRQTLEYATGDTSIDRLIDKGVVAVPVGQRRDFKRLQKAFDGADLGHFERTLAAVEQKYLAAQVSA